MSLLFWNWYLSHQVWFSTSSLSLLSTVVGSFAKLQNEAWRHQPGRRPRRSPNFLRNFGAIAISPSCIKKRQSYWRVGQIFLKLLVAKYQLHLNGIIHNLPKYYITLAHIDLNWAISELYAWFWMSCELKSEEFLLLVQFHVIVQHFLPN